MKNILISICFAVLPLMAWQSSLRLDHLDRLSARASTKWNITIDASLLQLASGFIDDDDQEAAEIKKLVSGLKGIYIRSLEFGHTGEYQDADVDQIRAQLKDPQWKRIVETHSKTEGDADIFVRADANRMTGIVILSAEPKELTVINIEGVIDPSMLRKLRFLGVPHSAQVIIDKNEKKLEDKAK